MGAKLSDCSRCKCLCLRMKSARGITTLVTLEGSQLGCFVLALFQWEARTPVRWVKTRGECSWRPLCMGVDRPAGERGWWGQENSKDSSKLQQRAVPEVGTAYVNKSKSAGAVCSVAWKWDHRLQYLSGQKCSRCWWRRGRSSLHFPSPISSYWNTF